MNKQEKEALVHSLKKDLSASVASFVVGVKGMSVVQFESLRKELRKEESKIKVAKVRLMKRALGDDISVPGLEAFMKDQVALVFAQKEAPGVAKILCTFAKNHEQLKVLGGCMEASLLNASQVKEIAFLPSREVLLAQLVGVLQAPSTQLVVVLKRMLSDLVYTLDGVAKKKAE